MIDLPELDTKEEEGIVQKIKEIISQISKITHQDNFLVVLKNTTGVKYGTSDDWTSWSKLMNSN